MALWWVLGIAAAVTAIRFAVVAARRGDEGRESPEHALKRRYANGELDSDTYERMLSDLRK